MSTEPYLTHRRILRRKHIENEANGVGIVWRLCVVVGFAVRRAIAVLTVLTAAFK